MRSQTAARRGIDNTPPPVVVERLQALCVNVLEPLRALARAPIHITSGYRSQRLNRAIGGASTSQHVLGEAADLVMPGLGSGEIFNLIRRSGLDFDQMIEEGTWIHLSYTTRRPNRRECLRAWFINGKAYYQAA